MENSNPGMLKKFTAWTFQSGYDPKDALMEQIQQNLVGKASIMELLKQYMKELGTSPDHKAVQFDKMAKLFQFGMTPDEMEGHFYGIAL